DGVHHAMYIGQQPVFRDQRRVYAQLDALLGTPGNAQMLDAVTEGFRVVDVRRGQLGDALGVGLVELQRNTEGNAAYDGQLVCSVYTFDIEGRIDFGVAQRLGLGQRVGKGETHVTQFCQDEVAGTFNDSRQSLDAVDRQTFTQRLEVRNATGYR